MPLTISKSLNLCLKNSLKSTYVRFAWEKEILILVKPELLFILKEIAIVKKKSFNFLLARYLIN